MFLTGDVHYAELSKLNEENLYPIYDFTSSGLSSTWDFSTPNSNRIKGPIMENQFGLLTINWEENNPEIIMEVWDVNNTLRFKHSILLSEISFKSCSYSSKNKSNKISFTLEENKHLTKVLRKKLMIIFQLLMVTAFFTQVK